jgi:N-acetylglutamate synthase-like GNAT family acetyltransferase
MLSKNMALRRATENDWPAVAALLEVNKLPLEGAHEHIAAYLLALSNDELIGSAGLEVYADIALMRSVAVAPDLRRQGIGKILVSQLLQEARRRHIAKVCLLTSTAPGYFLKFGFNKELIEKAPQVLTASAEFQGACPASAAFMSLTLTYEPAVEDNLPVSALDTDQIELASKAGLSAQG